VTGRHAVGSAVGQGAALQKLQDRLRYTLTDLPVFDDYGAGTDLIFMENGHRFVVSVDVRPAEEEPS
jgi:hypothetical protein